MSKSWQRPTQNIPKNMPTTAPTSMNHVGSNSIANATQPASGISRPSPVESSSLITPPQYFSPFLSPFSMMPGMGMFGNDTLMNMFYSFGFARSFAGTAYGVILNFIHDLKLDSFFVSLWRKMEQIPLVVPIKKLFWKVYIMIYGEANKNDKSGYLFLIGLLAMVPYVYRRIHMVRN